MDEWLAFALVAEQSLLLVEFIPTNQMLLARLLEFTAYLLLGEGVGISAVRSDHLVNGTHDERSKNGLIRSEWINS
jgi:hypothetical protein